MLQLKQLTQLPNTGTTGGRVLSRRETTDRTHLTTQWETESAQHSNEPNTFNVVA